ncbi:MAG: PH domain-containing protein [Thermofilaceae archaeon]
MVCLEEVCWKPVVWAFWDGIVGGALLAAVSALLLFYRFALAHVIAVVGLALGAAMILLAVVRAAANTYFLSKSHVRRVYRLVVVRVDEAPLDKITNVVVEQGVLGRILGFGDVRCDTAGTAFAGVLFKGVKRPESVAETIRGRIEAARRQIGQANSASSPQG